jgi:hypothetical protein
MKNVNQNVVNTNPQYKASSGNNLFNSPTKTKTKIENNFSSKNGDSSKLKINNKIKDFSLSPFKLEDQFPMKINLNEGVGGEGDNDTISTNSK